MSLALPSPRLMAADSVPALRWGVIGTGIAAVSSMRSMPIRRSGQWRWLPGTAKTQAFAGEHE